MMLLHKRLQWVSRLGPIFLKRSVCRYRGARGRFEYASADCTKRRQTSSAQAHIVIDPWWDCSRPLYGLMALRGVCGSAPRTCVAHRRSVCILLGGSFITLKERCIPLTGLHKRLLCSCSIGCNCLDIGKGVAWDRVNSAVLWIISSESGKGQFPDQLTFRSEFFICMCLSIGENGSKLHQKGCCPDIVYFHA